MQQNMKAQLINRNLQISRLQNLMACCKDMKKHNGLFGSLPQVANFA
jgi:hypothetical protein